ncbi:MAG: phosphotransferase [Propionibacteriaceae bacterium]|nr:phosphotransferase [Propionibacteriaceae bacterium]
MSACDLSGWLTRLAGGARWFSGHSRVWEVAEVELLPWLAEPGEQRPGVRSAVLHIRYDDGTTERYHVPLSLHPERDEPCEAVDDPQAMAILLECLADGAEGFHPRRPIPLGLPPQRYRGEQSNTSVFFGDALVAKVFRRLEEGRNLDVELHEVLADSGAVAKLLGTWSHAGTDLGVFLEALPEPRDGFVVACEAARSRTPFVEAARALGEQLAVVHRLLAERLPTAVIDGTDLARGFVSRFEAAAAEVPVLDQFREVVLGCLNAVRGLSLPAQRVHGDCHLGQALLTGGQWRYVDFEGEPLKSLAERRQPDSPCRDVAGMLRSFDYAAHIGEADEGWRRAAREAFLAGFGADQLLPTELLLAYEVDKAVYEVVYESRNRPTFLPVPVDCLARINH